MKFNAVANTRIFPLYARLNALFLCLQQSMMDEGDDESFPSMTVTVRQLFFKDASPKITFCLFFLFGEGLCFIQGFIKVVVAPRLDPWNVTIVCANTQNINVIQILMCTYL